MRVVIISLLALFAVQNISAQSLEDLIDEGFDNQVDYTIATFKASRIINGHSVEQMKKQELDFRISHRFGAVNRGISDFFGLDKSSIRLAFEYGITDWLMVGVARSSFNSTYDSFAKFRLLRQSKGGKFQMPVSLTYLASIEANTKDFQNPDQTNFVSSRISYVHQLLIARKFNSKISLQLMPTVVHRNLVPSVLEMNDLYAVGIGGRYKITTRLALMAEYYYTIRPSRYVVEHQDPIAFGVDVETGGHVFQIMLTNTSVMNEGGFIPGANNAGFFAGNVHLGFNISRVFSLKKK